MVSVASAIVMTYFDSGQGDTVVSCKRCQISLKISYKGDNAGPTAQ